MGPFFRSCQPPLSCCWLVGVFTVVPPRIHAWLHRSRWFGPTLDDWHHYHGIRRSLKDRAIRMVVVVAACTLLFNSLAWYLQYLVIGLVGCGLYTIWTVPTLPDDAPAAPLMISE